MKKSCCFEKIIFMLIFLPVHVQYVCNESAKYQIASTNTLRWGDFTILALKSCQSNFSRRQMESTVKELIHRPLFFSVVTPYQYWHLCKIWKKILKLIIKRRSRNQKAFSRITLKKALKKLTHRSLLFSNRNNSSISTLCKIRKDNPYII